MRCNTEISSRRLLAAAAAILAMGAAAALAQEGTQGHVALVNGEPITRAQYDAEMEHQTARFRVSGQALPEHVRDGLRESVLRTLVDEALVRQAAHLLGISVDPEELRVRLHERRAKFADDAAFQRYLEQAGLTREIWVEEQRKLLLADKLAMATNPVQPATLDEARAYYDEHPDRYLEPERVHASHILFRAAEDAKPAHKAEQRRKARQAVERIRGGAKFAAVAAQMSEGPTAKEGGDLGWIERGSMVESIEATLFSLDPGKPSGVLQSPFGYHILLVHERRPARQRPFAEVDKTIVEQLTARRINQARRNTLLRLRDAAQIDLLAPPE